MKWYVVLGMMYWHLCWGWCIGICAGDDILASVLGMMYWHLCWGWYIGICTRTEDLTNTICLIKNDLIKMTAVYKHFVRVLWQSGFRLCDDGVQCCVTVHCEEQGHPACSKCFSSLNVLPSGTFLGPALTWQSLKRSVFAQLMYLTTPVQFSGHKFRSCCKIRVC